MSFEPDKEIDRLLSRHARRSGSSTKATSSIPDVMGTDSVSSSSVNTGVHLDADEMSAFAENALPAATRSRYVSHLADCDTCRAVIVELAASADTAGALEKSVATVPSPVGGRRSWLGMLLAPATLRYAIPALALVSIAIIGITVWRSGQRPMVSTSDNRANSGASKPSYDYDSDANSLRRAQPAAPSATYSATPPNGPDSVAAEQASKTPGNTSEGDFKQQTPKDGPNLSGTLDRADAQPADKNEVAGAVARGRENTATDSRAPATAPKVTAGDDERGRYDGMNSETTATQDSTLSGKRTQTEGNYKGGGAEAGANQPRRAEEQRKLRDQASNVPPPAAKSAPPAARSKSSVAASAAGQTAAEDKDAGEKESRTVAGRRFVRRGNAWIDTAYNGSQATINVRRGSEQYRALAADEPDIRRAAEQFSGEVIIVAKGRAYRIY